MGDAIGVYACLLGVAAVVLALMGGVVRVALDSKERWLTRGKKVELGQGEYRTAPSTSDPRVRRRRWIVLALAMTNIPWGLFTLLVLVPAGGLAGLIAADSAHEPMRWFWIGIAFAAVDGIPVSILLMVAAFTLVRRSPRSTVLNAAASGWSAVHHAVIIALGIGYALGERYNAELGTTTAIIAGLGLVHAALSFLAAYLARPEPEPPE